MATFATFRALISKDEAAVTWGGESIAAGNQRKTGWWALDANIPFAISLEYRYSANGGPSKTTSARADCGPTVPANAPAPVVADISVESVATQIEPGSPLTVRYAASSSIGLWRSTVVVSGPCEIVRELNEPLSQNVNRVVSISLPIRSRCCCGRGTIVS